MNIRITETNEIRDLTIVDSQTDQDYTADMLARDTSLPRYDGQEQVQPMTAAQYEWWHAYLADLQHANDRYARLLAAISDDDDDAEILEKNYSIRAEACDLKDLPRAITEVCDTGEFRQAVAEAGKAGKTQADVASLLGLSLSSVEKRLAGSTRVRQGELTAMQVIVGSQRRAVVEGYRDGEDASDIDQRLARESMARLLADLDRVAAGTISRKAKDTNE